MPKLEISPSDDMTEVLIEIDGCGVKANAPQLDAIIEGLVAARARLLPRVPDNAPLGQMVSTTEDPRYWTNIDPGSGNTLLMLRHPGLGWLGFGLPPGERDRLAQYLIGQANAQQSGPAKTKAEPGGGLH